MKRQKLNKILVECHATSTRQGDVEEVRALKTFFNSSRRTVLTADIYGNEARVLIDAAEFGKAQSKDAPKKKSGKKK